MATSGNRQKLERADNQDKQQARSYSETFYPRSAEESESESTQTDEDVSGNSPGLATPLTMESTENGEEDEQNPTNIDHPKDVMRTDSSEGENVTCGVCFQILLDPISLGCGHSFCEICLAGMWKAARVTQPIPLCPMCREPWGKQGERLPSINLMLRNILEQLYPAKLQERRESLSSDDKKLLEDFTIARNKDRVLRPHGAHINRRIGVNIPINAAFIGIMLCIFFTAMILAAVFVSCALWLIDYDDEYMLKPVKQWSNEDVLAWMNGLGESVKKECMDKFEAEKIDGPHLLSISEDMLYIKFGVEDEFVRSSLLLSIQELREKERPEPRNFKEFRAVNKEEMKFVAALYIVHPRLTFLYLYLFQYKTMFLPLIKSQVTVSASLDKEDNVDKEIPDVELLKDWGLTPQDKETENTREEGEDPVRVGEPIEQEEPSLTLTAVQLVAIAIETVLVPHVIVMAFIYIHLGKDSVLFYVLLFNCGMSTFLELKRLRNQLRHPRGANQYSFAVILKTVWNNITNFIVCYLLLTVLYLIVPAVLSDLLLYGVLFYPLLYLLHGKVLRPCFSRTFRFIVVQINRRAQRGVV